MTSLAQVVAELADRVARLEARQAQPVQTVLDGDVEPPEHGRVVYSGVGPWQGRSVVWQMERTWADITGHEPSGVVRVLAALASPVRVRIIAALLGGPASTGDLTDRVEAGTSGQLFHHLKELLSAGLVHQPQRGTYALRPQHVLPILAALSAAMDLAPASEASAP